MNQYSESINEATLYLHKNRTDFFLPFYLLTSRQNGRTGLGAE
jgi:hypothetical protein